MSNRIFGFALVISLMLNLGLLLLYLKCAETSEGKIKEMVEAAFNDSNCAATLKLVLPNGASPAVHQSDKK